MNDSKRQKLERQQRAIWKDIEKELDITISQEERDFIDEYAGEVDCEEDLGYWENSVRQLTPLLKIKNSKIAKKYIPPPEDTQQPHRSYPRSLRKQVHILEFVIRKQITMWHLREWKFKVCKPIKWEKMSEDWNEAHPFDEKTKETLKRDYFRARQQENVRRAFWDKQKESILQSNLALRRLKWADLLANDPDFLYKHIDDLSRIIDNDLESLAVIGEAENIFNKIKSQK
jgi:hypothetical protein